MTTKQKIIKEWLNITDKPTDNETVDLMVELSYDVVSRPQKPKILICGIQKGEDANDILVRFGKEKLAKLIVNFMGELNK